MAQATMFSRRKQSSPVNKSHFNSISYSQPSGFFNLRKSTQQIKPLATETSLCDFGSATKVEQPEP